MRRLGGQAPPWGRYRRTGLGALGDISSIVGQLSQYGSDQILAAYGWLYQNYQSEQQDLIAMTQWASLAAGNMQGLSAADRQAYLAALQDETDVVNNMNSWVNQFQVVLQALGISPTLTGTRKGLGNLGWIQAAAVIVVVIGIVVGAGMYEYYQYKSVQAHETTAQVQAQTQASIAQSVQKAGGSPADIQKNLEALYKAQADENKQPFQIPWGTIGTVAVVVGVVFVAKSIFE